jgi:hypothetical protein
MEKIKFLCAILIYLLPEAGFSVLKQVFQAISPGFSGHKIHAVIF